MKTTTEFLVINKRRKKMSANLIRAVLAPSDNKGEQFTYTLQVKDANGNWTEITRVFQNPKTKKEYSTIEELREDLADGKDNQE